MLEIPTIIGIGGLPFAGKTTLGGLLSSNLGIHYVDIDALAFCAPRMEVEPYSTAKKAARERKRMHILYFALHALVKAHVFVGHSLILSAVYREKSRRDALIQALGFRVNFEFLVCRLEDERTIAQRLEDRLRSHAVGGCRSMEQYRALLPAWTEPDFPHHVIDTSRGHFAALQQALRAIKA